MLKNKNLGKTEVLNLVLYYSDENSRLCFFCTRDLPACFPPHPPTLTPSINRSDLEGSCRGPKETEITVIGRGHVSQNSPAELRPARSPDSFPRPGFPGRRAGAWPVPGPHPPTTGPQSPRTPGTQLQLPSDLVSRPILWAQGWTPTCRKAKKRLRGEPCPDPLHNKGIPKPGLTLPPSRPAATPPHSRLAPPSRPGPGRTSTPGPRLRPHRAGSGLRPSRPAPRDQRADPPQARGRLAQTFTRRALLTVRSPALASRPPRRSRRAARLPTPRRTPHRAQRCHPAGLSHQPTQGPFSVQRSPHPQSRDPTRRARETKTRGIPRDPTRARVPPNTRHEIPTPSCRVHMPTRDLHPQSLRGSPPAPQALIPAGVSHSQGPRTSFPPRRGSLHHWGPFPATTPQCPSSQESTAPPAQTLRPESPCLPQLPLRFRPRPPEAAEDRFPHHKSPRSPVAGLGPGEPHLSPSAEDGGAGARPQPRPQNRRFSPKPTAASAGSFSTATPGCPTHSTLIGPAPRPSPPPPDPLVRLRAHLKGRR